MYYTQIGKDLVKIAKLEASVGVFTDAIMPYAILMRVMLRDDSLQGFFKLQKWQDGTLVRTCQVGTLVFGKNEIKLWWSKEPEIQGVGVRFSNVMRETYDYKLPVKEHV